MLFASPVTFRDRVCFVCVCLFSSEFLLILTDRKQCRVGRTRCGGAVIDSIGWPATRRIQSRRRKRRRSDWVVTSVDARSVFSFPFRSISSPESLHGHGLITSQSRALSGPVRFSHTHLDRRRIREPSFTTLFM